MERSESERVERNWFVISLLVLLFVVALGLSGCDPYVAPTKVSVDDKTTVVESSRVSIELIARFEDRSAYGSVRKIYLIRDNATGIEYFGVTGVGIAEVGKHKAGKSSTTDER